MFESKQKRNRLNIFDRLLIVVFWGFGYFFGYSLVTIFSLGLFRAEEFFYLNRHSQRVFKKHEQLFFSVRVVAMIGWGFVLFLMFLISG